MGQAAPQPDEALLQRIARDRVMEGACVMAGGSRLYRMPRGWESALLRGDPLLAKVKSGLQLDQLIEDPDQPALLVLAEAALPFARIQAAAERAALPKTLFVEE